MTLPVIPTFIRTKAKPPVDPSDYGLIADGASHPLSERYATLSQAQADYPFVTSLLQQIDWAACKLTSNIAFGVDGSENGTTNVKLNRKISLPPGDYWFGNDTWLIRNLASGVIEGAGQLATTLRGNATVLAFDGIWYTTISDLSVRCATTTATAAMELDGNIPGHPYTTRGVQAVLLQSVLIDGGMSQMALAVCRQGGSGAQGSEMLFNKVHLQSASFACYYQNGFNALANQFVGGNIQSYTANGIYVVAGTISVYGTGFQSTTGYTQIENDGWDIHVGTGVLEGIPIIGCRTESLRFLKNEGSVQTLVSAVVGRASVTSWFANTAYGGASPNGKVVLESGRLYLATTPGTSGSVEPIWPTDGSSTVSDGSIVWQEVLFDAVSIPPDPRNGGIDKLCSFSAGKIDARRIDDSISKYVSASYQVLGEDVILADATAGPITVTLPNTPCLSRRVLVKKLDASSNAVTVAQPVNQFEGPVGTVVIAGGSRGWREFLYFDGDSGGARRWQIIGSG